LCDGLRRRFPDAHDHSREFESFPVVTPASASVLSLGNDPTAVLQ
jgi:hypothetical protein